MRYFKCQDFGHMAVICKKSCRCYCFGGVLEFGKCIVGVNWKCCNCRGNHSVAFWGYEVVKREFKKCSIHQAVWSKELDQKKEMKKYK